MTAGRATVLDVVPNGNRTGTGRPPVRHRLLLSGLALLYAGVLEDGYTRFVSPTFSYLGYRHREPETFGHVVSIVLAVGLTALMPLRLKRASDLVLWVLLLLATLPAVLVPQYADIISSGEALKLALVVSAVFAGVVMAAPRGPVTMVPLVRLPASTSWLVVGLVSVGTYGYMALTTGLSLDLVSLLQVQDVRFGYRHVVATSGPLLGYLIAAQGNVLNPFMIAVGLGRRSVVLVGAGVLGQLLIFSATGYKMIVLSPLAVAGLVLMVRRAPVPRAWPVMGFVTGVAWVSVALDSLRDLGFTQIFLTRLLATPGVLTAAYVMVFQGEPPARWGYSFLSGYVSYPYTTDPAFVVGAAFSNSPKTSANANFFADGYANLGYGGVVLEGLVLVLVLWGLNSSTRGLPMAVVTGVLVTPAIALSNSSALTAVLSAGLAVAMLLSAALPREDAQGQCRLSGAVGRCGAQTSPRRDEQPQHAEPQPDRVRAAHRRPGTARPGRSWPTSTRRSARAAPPA